MIGRIFICILAIFLTGIASWLALWCANVFNYLISLPFSIIDIIAENSNDFIRFIYLAITTGIAYFVSFLMCFDIIYGRVCEIVDGHEWFDYLGIILLAICIIVICDPRLHTDLSPSFTNIIYHIKEEYNYNILGTVDWNRLDFSGDRVPAMQYTIFNIAVALAAVCGMIIKNK